MRSLVPSLLLISIALALCGCLGGVPREPAEPAALSQAQPPADFTIAVTVYSPISEAWRLRDSPRMVRPARYVVEADGVLRVAVGPGADETTFPPITRQLTPPQVATLWAAVRSSGMLDREPQTRIPSADGFEPVAQLLAMPDPIDDSAATTAVISVSENGRRRAHAVTLAGPGVDAAPLATLSTRALVERLARLSWAQ